MLCPKCHRPMEIKSSECSVCKSRFEGSFPTGFLSTLDAGSTQTLLALIAARGRTLGVAQILGINRNQAAGLLSQLRMQLLSQALTMKDSQVDAAQYVSFCERIDREDEENQNS